MKARVMIPVTVTYTGYYEVEPHDLEHFFDEQVDITQETRERHWEQGVRQLEAHIRGNITEYGVFETLREGSLETAIHIKIEQIISELRTVFEQEYAGALEESL
jgi:hypothetical protein